MVDRWHIFIFDIDSLVLWCFRFQGPQCLKRGTIRPGRSKLSLWFSWTFLLNSFLLWLEVSFSYLLIFSLQRLSAKLELEGNSIGGYNDHFQKNNRLWTEKGGNNFLRYHTLTREEVYTTSSLMASLDNKEVKICAIVNMIHLSFFT